MPGSARSRVGLGAIGQVQDLGGHPGAALDRAGASAAQGLVAGERSLGGAAAEQRRQGDGVLDGLVGALAVVRQHRMRGIAEQHDPVAVPAVEGSEPTGTKPRKSLVPEYTAGSRQDRAGAGTDDRRRFFAFAQIYERGCDAERAAS
ncbi:hypothetical protein GCM10009854_37980 [Saccharopolyspora halophila]|uniref:Uncharacterized protein n=1 Tax=Saccharopolyspora halophila TaxID=405551 RepID=A0ABP5TN41_9PSEU